MLEWIRGSVWERVYGRKCMGGRECKGSVWSVRVV